MDQVGCIQHFTTRGAHNDNVKKALLMGDLVVINADSTREVIPKQGGNEKKFK